MDAPNYSDNLIITKLIQCPRNEFSNSGRFDIQIRLLYMMDTLGPLNEVHGKCNCQVQLTSNCSCREANIPLMDVSTSSSFLTLSCALKKYTTRIVFEIQNVYTETIRMAQDQSGRLDIQIRWSLQHTTDKSNFKYNKETPAHFFPFLSAVHLVINTGTDDCGIYYKYCAQIALCEIIMPIFSPLLTTFLQIITWMFGCNLLNTMNILNF